MRSYCQAAFVGSSNTSSRIARRRAAQRAAILSIAAQRFAEHGVDRVRLDQIADEADVARNTLYSHFSTKEALVEAIVRPGLEQGLSALRKLRGKEPRQRIDGVLEAYLQLWRQHRDSLRVASRLQSFPSGNLAELHQAFAQGVLTALRSAARAGILRVKNPTIAARLVMRVAIPLLELYLGYPNAEQLFHDSMQGLLLLDQPPPQTPTKHHHPPQKQTRPSCR